MPLNLRVMAPNRTLWNSEVEELVLSVANGQIGILPNHAPLITLLRPGMMKMRINGQWAAVSLMQGLAQLDSNQVIVLVAKAGEAGEAQFLEAQQAFQSAEAQSEAPNNRQA